MGPKITQAPSAKNLREKRLLLVVYGRYESYEGHWVKTGYRRRYHTPQMNFNECNLPVEIYWTKGNIKNMYNKWSVYLPPMIGKKLCFFFEWTNSTTHSTLADARTTDKKLYALHQRYNTSDDSSLSFHAAALSPPFVLCVLRLHYRLTILQAPPQTKCTIDFVTKEALKGNCLYASLEICHVLFLIEQ